MEGFNFFYGLNQNLFPKTNQCEETNGHGDLYCFFHTNKDLDLVVLLLFYAILGEKITKKNNKFYVFSPHFIFSMFTFVFPFSLFFWYAKNDNTYKSPTKNERRKKTESK